MKDLLTDLHTAERGSNCSSGGGRHLTTEERLISQLFRHYDVDSRGVVNASRTITVHIQFLLLRVQRLVGYEHVYSYNVKQIDRQIYADEDIVSNKIVSLT